MDKILIIIFVIVLAAIIFVNGKGLNPNIVFVSILGALLAMMWMRYKHYEEIHDESDDSSESDCEAADIADVYENFDNDLDQVEDIQEEHAEHEQVGEIDFRRLNNDEEWAGGDRFQKYYYGMHPQAPGDDHGNGWGSNPRYTACYGPVSSEMNGCDLYSTMSIDEKMARSVRQRNNEKRVLDGWASKNMYYARKHFADELDIEEQKRWWGNEEY